MNSVLSRSNQWIRIQLVGYGAIELKKVYRKNISRSFALSVAIALLSSGMVQLLVPSKESITPQRALRIVAYEEFVVPSSVTAMGMNASLALPRSEDNALDLKTKTPSSKPKGAQTRRVTLPPRDFSKTLGDLPSLGAAERADQASLRSDDAAAEKSGIVGGDNGHPTEGSHGGNPILSTSRESNVGGAARSGVGSASKPSPEGSAINSGDLFGVADGSGGGRGFSLEWLQGGTRKKIAGELPQYPKGVNLEAELAFYATVDPDGTIRAILPAQKADSRLERSVIEALRGWKFEALAPSFPQLEQTCLLKFTFQLK